MLDELRSGKPRVSAPAKKIEAILDELYDYMNAKGVKLVDDKGELHDLQRVPKEKYFPREYDQDYLRSEEGRNAFFALMAKHKISDARGVYDKVTRDVNSGVPHESDSIGLTYFDPHTKSRMLDIPDSELAPFLNKELFGTLSKYIGRTVRRSEYAVRFGNKGEEIATARAEAVKLGMTPEQTKIFDDSVRAHDGTLGADMNPQTKQIYGALMTYQNIRLLPLQLFSSLVDPLGMMVRGGSITDATTGFLRGVRELAGLKADDAYHLAKTIGSIDANFDAHLMSEMANSQYMPKGLDRKSVV